MRKISFIGAGSMSEAILSGIIRNQKVDEQHIYVTNKTNKDRLKRLEEAYGIKGCTNFVEVLQQANIIILATKPDDIEEVLKEGAPYINENQLIISVIAGISTNKIVECLEKKVPVVRTMPNTSATIGYSATAICKGKYATDTHLAQAKSLFTSIGTVSVVDEEDMHIVTGISGSGPAYIYYFVEAMEKVAKEEGLDEQIANELITQTIIGAGEMLKQGRESASTLRKRVTSPNGTTEAGIKTLEKYNFQEAIVQCVKSATNRSKELGASFKK